MRREEILEMQECPYEEACPHLNFEPAARVLAQRDYLSKRVDEMERIMSLATEKIEELRERNKVLEEERKSLKQELNGAIGLRFKPSSGKEEERPQKKRGSPIGHQGSSWKRPERIDEYIDIYPAKCHRCGGEDITIYEHLFEEHVVEDIEVRVKNTCYRSHYGYCQRCKKVVCPQKEAEILPRSHIGPNARAIFAYLRYIGIPFRKGARISRDIFGLGISHPSLLDFDNKIARNGEPVYEKIKDEVDSSPSINVDETSWRVNGKNFWLWDFVNKRVALFRIEKERSSKVVKDTLGEEYQGIMTSDFYSVYNDNIKAKGKQKCLAHLLREIKKITEKNLELGSQEKLLCSSLTEALKGAIKMWNEFQRGEKTIEDLKAVKEVTAQKFIEFISIPSENKDIQRLKKRLIKHQNELLTFLDQPEIEPTNNRAERALRASVIMRKITFGSRSPRGARNHQVIMSILQTALLHGLQPLPIFLSLATNQERASTAFPEKFSSSTDKEPKRIRAP
jgi:hypothetical protein